MKRSLSGVMGAALVLMLCMPGLAVAQTELPAADAITDTVAVAVAEGEPAYSAAMVTWTIADDYAASCGPSPLVPC